MTDCAACGVGPDDECQSGCTGETEEMEAMSEVGQGSAANDIITYGQQAKDMAEAARMIAYAAEAEGSRTA